MKLVALLLLLTALLACAFADCNVSIKQSLGSAWQQDGKNMSQWNVQLTAGTETVSSLALSITGANITQFWELTQESNGLFALPDYILQGGGIVAGQTYQFGFIWMSSAQATITVSSTHCGSASASPSASPSPASPSSSPAAPSPSSSPSHAPASPSASPAAPSPSSSPSAAPSIVSTPQPSGCSMTVQQTARPASQGGSWTTGDFEFQIYDLTLTNVGNQPITAAQITINLSSNDQDIYQFWNIERLTATSSSFNVSTWGALQVGASLGAGYIVRSPLSAQSAAPSVSVSSITCSGASTAASPSPSAIPSPSATPSPSAAPTIVATPQPSPASGCSATVTIAARSAAKGGVWEQNGSTFQIFDLTITNEGQRPINGGVLTFAFAESGTSISQFWELNRQGSTDVFNVAINYGPLQVAASQGAGIVAGLAGSNAPSTPTVTLSSLACQ